MQFLQYDMFSTLGRFFPFCFALRYAFTSLLFEAHEVLHCQYYSRLLNQHNNFIVSESIPNLHTFLKYHHYLKESPFARAQDVGQLFPLQFSLPERYSSLRNDHCLICPTGAFLI